MPSVVICQRLPNSPRSEDVPRHADPACTPARLVGRAGHEKVQALRLAGAPALAGPGRVPLAAGRVRGEARRRGEAV